MFNEIHKKQFNRISELIRGFSSDEEAKEGEGAEAEAEAEEVGELDSEIVADALEDENYKK